VTREPVISKEPTSFGAHERTPRGEQWLPPEGVAEPNEMADEEHHQSLRGDVGAKLARAHDFERA
jgi:hypothetical protein